jgi:hypothetical protein
VPSEDATHAPDAVPYGTVATQTVLVVLVTTVVLLWPLLVGAYVEYGIAPWALSIDDLQHHDVSSVWYVGEAIWSLLVLGVAGRTDWLSRTA